MLKELCILFVFIGLEANVFGQNFEWASCFASNYNDIAYSTTTDSVGNIYTTGTFGDTIDFDPGPGVANLASNTLSDIFIQKLNSNGDFLWAKSFGKFSGNTSNTSFSITVDNSGYVYITGVFDGFNVDFDPGPGVFYLSETGFHDIFILKLDQNGDFVWAKSFGGVSSSGYSYSITTDIFDNIYFTGEFYGTIDFDPGVGIFNLTSSGNINNDAFIAKLDEYGDFLWAKSFGNTDKEVSNSVTLDLLGNVYATGNFEGTVDFDSGTGVFNLISGTNEGSFILKLDTNGDFLWAKKFGGFDTKSITIDVFRNIYSTGAFSGTADFDPGISVHNLTSIGVQDVFILKLDEYGDFLWAKSFEANESESITTDVLGNVYTTGSFSMTADFDPGTAIHNLSVIGYSDIFISKLDEYGNFIGALGFGGDHYDRGNTIIIDKNGNIITSGFFRGTADFDPGIDSFNITTDYNPSIFILKLSPDTITQGTITTSSSAPLQNSKVYLIQYFASTDSVFAADSTTTDAVGFYQFTNTFQNAYVKAVPDAVVYPNEIPTYNISSPVFQNADAVYLSYPFGNTDFSTIAGINPGGNGFIGGIVGNGAGKQTAVGQPIPNLSIILMNTNSEVVEQTTTDAGGLFSFDDLEETTFSLWVDKAGILNNLAPSISLATENVQDNLQFKLHETFLENITTVSIEELKNSHFEVYPNPTNGQLIIQNKEIQFSVELLNILGESVYLNAENKHQLIINLSKNNLSKGTYLLKLTTNGSTYVSKVVYQ